MTDASTVLTDGEAYQAMCLFLERYWERGLKQSDDIADLLSFTATSDDATASADPAQWCDWLAAVRDIKAGLRAP